MGALNSEPSGAVIVFADRPSCRAFSRGAIFSYGGLVFRTPSTDLLIRSFVGLRLTFNHRSAFNNPSFQCGLLTAFFSQSSCRLLFRLGGLLRRQSRAHVITMMAV